MYSTKTLSVDRLSFSSSTKKEFSGLVREMLGLIEKSISMQYYLFELLLRTGPAEYTFLATIEAHYLQVAQFQIVPFNLTAVSTQRTVNSCLAIKCMLGVRLLVSVTSFFMFANTRLELCDITTS